MATGLAIRATLFFQLINERYERASTVLTSNREFGERGPILGDEVMAAAPLDWLLHHCHLVNIRGNSYRLRDRRTFGTGARAAPGEKEPRTRAGYPQRRRPGEAARASGADLRSLRSLRPRPTRLSRNSSSAAYATETPPDPVNPPLRRHPITPKSGTFSKPIDTRR